MRVYRLKMQLLYTLESSLTASEGISVPIPVYPFIFAVPSLQVRVYRAGVVNVVRSGCSLTASEGISAMCTYSGKDSTFPHCK